MTCTVAARRQVRAAARECALHPTVVATDVVGPADDPSGKWTLEVVVEDATVPPPVLRALAEHDCALAPAASGTRGQPTHCVVVARTPA